ncbi:MAG: nucleoside monophosphate kinase [Candidatus Aminicenantes bacterium]|nr:nucleoside monophosphate kinase [Candidatus Aminicenantes bacterium]
MTIEAFLLVGPTGSGKTPLGEALESAGWDGRRCLHFDFGARLRAAAAGPENVPALSAEERNVVRDVLQTGALLDDRFFGIARKILEDFLRRREAGPGDLLVLNGLPRHAGQARDIAPVADVVRMILLFAPPVTVRERIRTDAAGDRAERGDDSPAEVERKLALYEQRTRPLIGHYEAKGVPVVRLEVGPKTSAGGLLEALRRAVSG